MKEMVNKHRFIALLIIALSILVTQTASLAQDSPSRLFPETGHWVEGNILEAYDENPNAEWVYGLPITGMFQVSNTGDAQELWYQYFERARFEYRPNNPEDLQVTISPLGAYLHDVAEPAEIITEQAGLSSCQYFSQSSHQVCFAFLEFFNTYGGISQFGYPVSEVEIRDGRKVQYFQKARFEWHPENNHGNRVVLSNIGTTFFKLNEDPKHILPDPYTENVIETTQSLEAQAFVEKAVIGSGEIQSLYIAVENQHFVPLENVEVTVYGLLDPTQNNTISTDENGLAKIDFTAGGLPGETIVIEISVKYNGIESRTQTSYRIWW